MDNRRKFLAKSGAAFTVPLLSTVTSAKREEKKKGIKKRIRRLLRDGQAQQAEKLAHKHDIQFVHQNVSGSSSGEVSTQDWFTNPGDNGTTVDFYMTGADSDSAVFHLDWNLYYDDTNLVDGASPADGAIIAWEDSQWGLWGLDEVYADTTQYAGDGSTKDITTELAGGGLIGERQNAIGIKVHDVEAGHSSGVERLQGYLQIKCRKQNFPYRTAGRVECLYKHSWSPFDNAYFNFIQNVTIGKGPLSISLDTGSDSWDFRDDIVE